MKHIARIFALTFTLLPMLAAAQFNGPRQLVAQVPFQFRVGDKLVPAGKCTVESATDNSDAMMIRNVGARVSLVSSALPAESKTAAAQYAMVFHKYGDRYFLVGIRLKGLHNMYRLPESRGEAELRAQNLPATEEIVIASRR